MTINQGYRVNERTLQQAEQWMIWQLRPVRSPWAGKKSLIGQAATSCDKRKGRAFVIHACFASLRKYALVGEESRWCFFITPLLFGPKVT